ncbi:MAG TPA: response regulator, partial [Caulifigura sp.]|nr:response regulator [Caulifigura sp.]
MPALHLREPVPTLLDFVSAATHNPRTSVANTICTIMPTLLLIDDDPAILPQQVRLTFPSPNYQVTVAATGAEGLQKFEQLGPDAVLLDLRLPDQTGLELYHKIREVDRRVPIIFITMTKGADDAIEAMKLGAFDYLFKPVDLKQLQRVVEEAVEVSRRMREPAVVP